MTRAALSLALVLLGGCSTSAPPLEEPTHGLAITTADLARVTTVAPFPRGLVLRDGTLYVLCRGRVRGAGGVSAAVEDQAGTIYAVDPDVAEPWTPGDVSPAVRSNGRLFAAPSDPPFRLWDRAADPPETDRLTDRPYCVLRYHAASASFYLCAFSGIDKPRTPGETSFSKNLTDALLRYDTRTQAWSELERHAISAGGAYPHHDPRYNAPPHGWLNGPDNCLVVGDWLYAVAKDNNRLVRYDLTPFTRDPHAPPSPGEPVLEAAIDLRGHGRQDLFGHSALAVHDDWLYLGYRTSSLIVRMLLAPDGTLRRPIVGELVARFDPYDPATGASADITDMDFDAQGRLYVVSAKPARVYRFTPDPASVFDARAGGALAWADLAQLTGNPRMKSENLLVDATGGRVFVTSGDGYDYQAGAAGTVYAVALRD